MNRQQLSERQKDHYESIHDDYEDHYYDGPSMEFRRRFIYDVMLRGIDFNDLRVADLACGSGHNSLGLRERFPRIQLAGFDISDRACRAYETNVGEQAYCVDLTKRAPIADKFDAAIVIGGLHHCVADLPGTFETIGSLIKPGGKLLMFEPNRQYCLEGLRKIWYRLDPYFEEKSEAALAHDEVLELAASSFRGVDVRYMGGPAYFLIFNSMLFRLHPRLKRWVSAPLMAAERSYNLLPWRYWFPYFIARWQRIGGD